MHNVRLVVSPHQHQHHVQHLLSLLLCPGLWPLYGRLQFFVEVFCLDIVLCLGLVRVRLGLAEVVGVGGVVGPVVDLTPDVEFIFLQLLYLGPQFRNFWI